MDGRPDLYGRTKSRIRASARRDAERVRTLTGLASEPLGSFDFEDVFVCVQAHSRRSKKAFCYERFETCHLGVQISPPSKIVRPLRGSFCELVIAVFSRGPLLPGLRSGPCSQIEFEPPTLKCEQSHAHQLFSTLKYLLYLFGSTTNPQGLLWSFNHSTGPQYFQD